MEKQRLESKAVNWVRYDEDKQVLEVEYASSIAYRYFCVPRDVYGALLKVESKGEFVNRLVRDSYDYERIGAERLDDGRSLRELLEKSIDPEPEG